MSIIYEYQCNNDIKVNLIYGVFIFLYRYLLTIIAVFIISFALVGVMFNLSYGLMVGCLLAVIILVLFSKWGEKLVLVFAKARYVTDDETLINQVKNFCVHLNVHEVKIYWSNAFVNNVYYSDSYFGKPALIIGKNIYNQFSRNELNSLIYASILKIKSGEAKNRTMVSLIFFVLYSPVYIIRSFFNSYKARKNLEIFFYPAFSIKTMMYENEKSVINFDSEVGKMIGLKKDYMAALFKITHLPSFNERTIGALVVAELSHAKNETEDVLASLLFKTVDIKTRIKALGSN
ncbi:MAG: hypothetical protein H7177_01460 [Rhizobacter sp.]|nr:hypothetical protein [Bacteriovorax sp.]